MPSALEAATALADTLLAPDASEVDRSGIIPVAHFDALAAAGLYGITLSDERLYAAAVAEHLVSGCLATGFVWAQHHGVVMAVAQAGGRGELLADLAAGRVRAGVSFAGLASHGRTLRLRRTGSRLVVSGRAAFVTGWGLTDVLGAWAHDADRAEDVMVLVPEAQREPGIEATPLDLVAARASRTVSLRWYDVEMDESAVLVSRPAEKPPSNAALSTRLNGALALGTCRSALRTLRTVRGPEAAAAVRAGTAELDGVRAAMDGALADLDEMYRLRGRAADLAVRLATAAVAATGSGAVLAGSDPERLLREALFCIVCASRPQIRSAVLGLAVGEKQRG